MDGADDERACHPTDRDVIGSRKLQYYGYGSSLSIEMCRLDLEACILEINITGIMSSRVVSCKIAPIPLPYQVS